MDWKLGRSLARRLGSETRTLGLGNLGPVSGLLQHSPHQEGLRAADICGFQEGQTWAERARVYALTGDRCWFTPCLLRPLRGTPKVGCPIPIL